MLTNEQHALDQGMIKLNKAIVVRQIFAVNLVAEYNRKEITYKKLCKSLSDAEIIEAMHSITRTRYTFGDIK